MPADPPHGPAGPIRLLQGAAAIALPAVAASAQITTRNAGVLSPEVVLLRESLEAGSTAALDELRWTTRVQFSPDARNEIGLAIPLVRSDVDTFIDGHPVQSLHTGLGDVRMEWKRALCRRDGVLESDRLALYFDLSVPSGDSDVRAGGVELPRLLQPGTGAWTVGAGAGWTWIRDRQRLALESMYRWTSRHDGLQLGAAADVNAAWWYRISPAVFDAHGSDTELRGLVELLSSWRFHDSDPGTLNDSGLMADIAPGLQWYLDPRIQLEAQVRLPVAMEFEDSLGDRRWAAQLAVKIQF